MHRYYRGTLPNYFSGMLTLLATTSHCDGLQSISLGNVTMTNSHLHIGQHVFRHCGPYIWNSLPLSKRDPLISTDKFKRRLMTHLINIAFNWILNVFKCHRAIFKRQAACNALPPSPGITNHNLWLTTSHLRQRCRWIGLSTNHSASEEFLRNACGFHCSSYYSFWGCWDAIFYWLFEVTESECINNQQAKIQTNNW